jgi:hypothetical protein
LSRRSRRGKSTCSNAPQGPEIRSFVYIQIRSFVYIRITACEVVQDPTLLPGPSVRCRSALRRRADNPRAAWQSGHGLDTHRAPASRFLPTGITAHSFPGNILDAPGSGARRGLRRNTVATGPGANQETTTEEQVASLRNLPTRAISRSIRSLPVLCDGPYHLRHPDHAGWHRLLGSAQSWAATVSATAAGEVAAET